MPLSQSFSLPPVTAGSALVVRARLRAQARSLLRAARSGALSQCLPALRRLHAAEVFGTLRLSELVAARQQVRLKHCLRALAREFGFASWEAMVPQLATLPAERLDRDRLQTEGSASLHLWFRNEQEAREYVACHGGRLIMVGAQAAWLPDR